MFKQYLNDVADAAEWQGRALGRAAVLRDMAGMFADMGRTDLAQRFRESAAQCERDAEGERERRLRWRDHAIRQFERVHEQSFPAVEHKEAAE